MYNLCLYEYRVCFVNNVSVPRLTNVFTWMCELRQWTVCVEWRSRRHGDVDIYLHRVQREQRNTSQFIHRHNTTLLLLPVFPLCIVAPLKHTIFTESLLQ